jgi:hypothetical protein
MLAGRISGATRVLVAPADMPARSMPFATLAVRDELLAGHSSMASAWYPTTEEIARLTLGAPIYLHLVGREHPPVAIEVGRLPTPEPA